LTTALVHWLHDVVAVPHPAVKNPRPQVRGQPTTAQLPVQLPLLAYVCVALALVQSAHVPELVPLQFLIHCAGPQAASEHAAVLQPVTLGFAM
jgi:hypothetical protein